MSQLQRLPKLAGEVKGSGDATPYETSTNTSIARDETREHGDNAQSGAENIHNFARGRVCFDGWSDFANDGIDGLASERCAVAERLGVLVEELVNSVDVPKSLKRSVWYIRSRKYRVIRRIAG